jgi:hypothetical protein
LVYVTRIIYMYIVSQNCATSGLLNCYEEICKEVLKLL